MTSVYVYAALLLHKAGRPVTADNITKVLVDGLDFVPDVDKVKQLVAVLEGVDITEVLRGVTTAEVFKRGEQKGKEVEIARVEVDVTKKKDDDNATGLGQLFGDL